MEDRLPPGKKNRVNLSDDDKAFIESVLDDPAMSQERKNRARVLSLADESEGVTRMHQEIADEADVGTTVVSVVSRRFLSEGVQTAILGKRRGGPRPNTGRGGHGSGGGVSMPRTLTKEQEAEIKELYGTTREDGQKWTYDRLAEQYEVSHGTIGNTLLNR